MVKEETRQSLEATRIELARLTTELARLVDQVKVEIEHLREDNVDHE